VGHLAVDEVRAAQRLRISFGFGQGTRSAQRPSRSATADDAVPLTVTFSSTWRLNNQCERWTGTSAAQVEQRTTRWKRCGLPSSLLIQTLEAIARKPFACEESDNSATKSGSTGIQAEDAVPGCVIRRATASKKSQNYSAFLEVSETSTNQI